jgi:hypothetical protein
LNGFICHLYPSQISAMYASDVCAQC